MRVAKAQGELFEFSEKFDAFDDDFSEKQQIKISELREKYDIPKEVWLFLDGVDSTLIADDAAVCVPHISAFIKGKLTDDSFWDLIAFFEETAECDYGWILIERPIGFYDSPCTDDMNSIRKEMEEIGTRSRSKNTNLKRIGLY